MTILGVTMCTYIGHINRVHTHIHAHIDIEIHRDTPVHNYKLDIHDRTDLSFIYIVASMYVSSCMCMCVWGGGGN